MKVEWAVFDVKNGWNRKDLLKLYHVYQDRQMGDLDLHFKFTNYYVVALTALLSVFAWVLTRVYNEQEAGLIAFIPLLVVLLVHQAKLTTFRFYRRYTEGKVRLVKIEYLLSLLGPIEVEKPSRELEPQGGLWWEDSRFLPERYIKQSPDSSKSSAFIIKRSWHYGLGTLTQKTLSLFSIFSWLAIICLPFVLCYSKPDKLRMQISYASSTLAAVIGVVSLIRYFRSREAMIDETPGYMRKSVVGCIKASFKNTE